MIWREADILPEDTSEDVGISPTGFGDGLINIGWGGGQGFDALAKPFVSVEFVESDAGLEHLHQREASVGYGLGDDLGGLGNGPGKRSGNK